MNDEIELMPEELTFILQSDKNDPNGSYTGIVTQGDDLIPVQDVDDL